MARFIIPVSWEVYSTVTVEAATLEEAKRKFDKQIDDIPLCVETEYVEGSYRCTAESMEELEIAQEYRYIGSVNIN